MKMVKKRYIVGFYILMFIFAYALIIFGMIGACYFDSNIIQIFLSFTPMILYWVIIVKIIKNIKKFPFVTFLFFVFCFCSFFWSIFDGAEIRCRVYAKMHAQEGFFVMKTKKGGLSLGVTGLRNDYYIGTRINVGHDWSLGNDTILIAMLVNEVMEREEFIHFIYEEKPTKEQLCHASKGWYFKDGIEQPFPDSLYCEFEKKIRQIHLETVKRIKDSPNTHKSTK